MAKCICKRCGYEWEPRGNGKPKSCPYCHSYKWDEEKGKKEDGSVTVSVKKKG